MRRGGLRSWAVFVVVIAAVALPTTVSASHCSGDKDHLEDAGTGSCGYYVQPVPSPLPSLTPTPTPTQPVTVENRPDVRVVQPNEDAPLRVEVTNQTTPAEGSGWQQADRELLAAIKDQQRLTHFVLTVFAGFVLFALAGLLVFGFWRGIR